jgi:Domain of unknown function (DUF4365)
VPLALLTDNDRKEQLSRAYVAAIAAHSGFTVSIPDLDRDSIDIQVSSGTSRRASVQFQLKATSSPDWDGDELKFQLKAKNHNDMVMRRQVPLLLAVMVLPDNPTDWLVVDDTQLAMKRCVWWASLIGRPPTEQGSVQVRLQKTDVLTSDALKDLIGLSEDNKL